MKKILLVVGLLWWADNLYAQQFSQYNTGTLYDSFEHPSQRAFTPDTSRQYAFNFLLPNFGVNAFLNGDAQGSLKSRYFLNTYNNSSLLVNQGKNNNFVGSGNAYLFMFKMFLNYEYASELGFSWQTRVEGRGMFSDETVAAFNGTSSFDEGGYSNIFNDSYYFQSYHQVSVSYRQMINPQLAFGIKFSGLLGIQYQQLKVISSSAFYAKNQDQVTIGLQGTYFRGGENAFLTNANFSPSFKNPGASTSFGTTYTSESGYTIQANIKDLGFIYWNKTSNSTLFNGQTLVSGLSQAAREDSIYNKVKALITGNLATNSFFSPTDGTAELSIMRSFVLDDISKFKYSPTLVLSKEIFYTGYIGALVNPFEYKHNVLTLTTSYDNYKNFNLGLQYMYKTANWELFVGSDKLGQSASLLSDESSKNEAQVARNSSFTGADFFVGFSIKFGKVIEPQIYGDVIPMGD